VGGAPCCSPVSWPVDGSETTASTKWHEGGSGWPGYGARDDDGEAPLEGRIRGARAQIPGTHTRLPRDPGARPEVLRERGSSRSTGIWPPNHFQGAPVTREGVDQQAMYLPAPRDSSTRRADTEPRIRGTRDSASLPSSSNTHILATQPDIARTVGLVKGGIGQLTDQKTARVKETGSPGGYRRSQPPLEAC